MKKFKEIMAAMLAVVLAVATVVYAPVESYAEDIYTYNVYVTFNGDARGASDLSLTGDTTCVLTDGQSVKLDVKNTADGVTAKMYVYYSYNGENLETKERTVNEFTDTYTYGGFKTMFEGKGKTIPTSLGVSYSAELKSYGVDVTVTLTDATPASNTSTHTHTWKYGTIFDATEDTDGLEGYYCSCGANKETTINPSITAIYKNRYTQMDQAGKGEVITLKMGEWNTYSKEFMQHLISATERGVTVKLDYKYEKKNYVTTVPAGTTMDPAYEYYGPLFIQSLFETTKLN